MNIPKLRISRNTVWDVNDGKSLLVISAMEMRRGSCRIQGTEQSGEEAGKKVRQPDLRFKVLKMHYSCE